MNIELTIFLLIIIAKVYELFYLFKNIENIIFIKKCKQVLPSLILLLLFSGLFIFEDQFITDCFGAILIYAVLLNIVASIIRYYLRKIAPSKRCFGSLFSVLIVLFLPVLITYLLSGFEFTEGVQVVIIINFWFTIAGVIASFFGNISWGLHHDIYRKYKIEYPENLLFSFCQFAHAVMLPFIIFSIGMLITYRLN